MPFDLSKVLPSLPPMFTSMILILAIAYFASLVGKTFFESRKTMFESKKAAHEFRVLKKSSEAARLPSSAEENSGETIVLRPSAGPCNKREEFVVLTKTEIWLFFPYLFFLFICFSFVALGEDSSRKVAGMILYGIMFTGTLQLLSTLIVLRYVTVLAENLVEPLDSKVETDGRS